MQCIFQDDFLFKSVNGIDVETFTNMYWTLLLTENVSHGALEHAHCQQGHM